MHLGIFLYQCLFVKLKYFYGIDQNYFYNFVNRKFNFLKGNIYHRNYFNTN